MSQREDAVAGIVTFHPDPAALRRLVAAVAPDVREVVVFANSDLDDELERLLREATGPTGFAAIRPGANVGLGTAYNALAEHARARGAPFLFLLDQDSLPAAGTVPRLVAVHEGLAQAGERPAAVGPRPVDPEGEPMKIAALPAPADRSAARPDPSLAATRVGFVISSGSLLRCDTLDAVGPFRADFFIDAIDLEWCMRAVSRGFSIWVAQEVRMDHQLGRGVIRLPFGLRLADQPPRRLYTYLRNQFVMMRMAHVPRTHKAKMLVSLPVRLAVYLLRNRFSGEVRAALRNGLLDGLRGRLGAPDDAATSPRKRVGG